jgi:heme a synthase
MERIGSTDLPYQGLVKSWLLIGLFMVAGQILIGGITRLTGSGLSITRWEIVTGTLPPVNDTQWLQAFDLYKETPQYRLINQGMSLSEFKYIYFWEYVHRLWARSMGLMFLIPFLYFIWKRALTRKMVVKLLGLFALAALTASFGWIMVASGLVQRPWVNAYKLGIHLLLGFSVFIWLFHIWYSYIRISGLRGWDPPAGMVSGWLVTLIVVQVFVGGLVSGMKAGHAFPSWPLYNGEWLPGILLDTSHWRWSAFVEYDDSSFMMAFGQFFHRSLAYLIVLITVGLVWRVRKYGVWFSGLSRWSLGLGGLVAIQVCLGVYTLLGFRTGTPVELAAIHQFMGLMVLTAFFHMWYHQRIENNRN